MANLPYGYDSPGFQDKTASIGLDLRPLACDRDKDIPGWEREPPCLL